MIRHAFRCSLPLVLAGVGVLGGCNSKSSGGGGSFDGEKAPYGDRTPTSVTHSVIQKDGVTASAVTQVTGEKKIGDTTYTKIACTNTADPTSGVEWWIKEKAGESVTLAGWDGHSTLASGIVPPGVVTLDQPLTVSLNPPLNTPQTVTSGATIQVAGQTTVHQGQATISYTLVEDNAAIETSMGTVYGCKHFTGSATATSDLLPAALVGMTATGDLWYHPSYGIVAFSSPLLGIGMEISDANDCSAPDSSGHVIVRKMGIVDSAHRFDVSTYEDCNQAFDADKDVHAQMLLELRWADDAKAKLSAPDTLGPMMEVEFGTTFGYFPNTLTKSLVSVFHPEENGQGFNYLYAFVNQAAKNESTNGIAYHIGVRLDSGASAVRATGRIYYKKYGNSTKPDAAVPSGGRDAATTPIDAGRDTVTASAPELGRDVAVVVVPDAGSDARQDAAAPDAPALDAAKDGTVVIDGSRSSTANLIVNGDGEQGVASEDGSPVATPGWTSTGEATAVKYTCSGCPAATDPGSPTRGLNFFAGGLADPTSTLSQTISLAAYATAIDTGTLGFALQGYLGGYDGQDDNTVVSVSFRNASGTAVASASLGPVLSADRGGVTGMILKSTTGNVPAGARSAVVTLTMTRTEGTANDGWADDLSLVLLGVSNASGIDGGIDSGASQPITGTNLIVNGDGESGVGSGDGSAVAVPGWTVTGSATAIQYGASGGYPVSTDPGPTSRGLNFFGGGYDNPSVLTQTVSLAAYSTAIDSGKVAFALGAYLGGFAGQDDNATLTVSFLSSGRTSLGTASVGPVLAADRGGATGMLLQNTTGKVPAGAQSVVVTLTFSRTEGSANDGYADSLSLVLSGS
jgi:hypothetical protein